jgi:hypothetical protein
LVLRCLLSTSNASGKSRRPVARNDVHIISKILRLYISYTNNKIHQNTNLVGYEYMCIYSYVCIIIYIYISFIFYIIYYILYIIYYVLCIKYMY